MRQKICSVFVDFTTTQTGRQVFSLSASIYCSLSPCITYYPPFRHRLFCDRFFISCRSCGQTQLSQALAEHSSCALVPMNLSRVVVDPVLCCGDFFRCHLREIRALRVPAADHAVHVFIAAPLPRRIRVAVMRYTRKPLHTRQPTFYPAYP